MKKKIEFLIIGLTGAYGSGCTSLAQSICSLSTSFVRPQQIDNINKKIKEKYIVINNEKELLEKNNEKELLEKIKNYNSDLTQLLTKRKYINAILKFEPPKFQYISMSSVLVKSLLSFLKTDEFKKFSGNNNDVSEKLLEFYEKWKEIHTLFYSKKQFSFDEYEKIDNFLEEIETLKNQIKENECVTDDGKESLLQYLGDNFRKYGNPFGGDIVDYSKLESLAEETKILMKYYKNRDDDDKKSCFVIDAFRNPAEVDYFRKRYAQFFLISLDANKNVRRERFLKKSNDIDNDEFSNKFDKIDKRDSGDGNKITDFHCQNVSRCCHLSDIAIDNNDNYEKANLKSGLVDKLLKYFALLISPGCIPPTKEETLMNLAYSVSLKSTCISRKVGAVITDKKGFIVGMGWNDVAHTQIGCGYLTVEDYTLDNIYLIDLMKKSPDAEIDESITELQRNFAFCYKDELSKKKISKKIKEMNFKQTFKNNLSNNLSDSERASVEESIDNEIKKIIKKELSIKRLEYCRSLHAEENALLQVASRGGVGVEGGSIYTSTFPCELCAKKIYQSGIKEVYYTEPYPNSISESVFLKDGVNDIKLIPFEGVKSFAYHRLYKTQMDLKESQIIDNKIYD